MSFWGCCRLLKMQFHCFDHVKKINGEVAMSHKSFDHYTYRVTWSLEDGEYVALCTEFPSLSWLAAAPEAALAGIRDVVTDCVADMIANEIGRASCRERV